MAPKRTLSPTSSDVVLSPANNYTMAPASVSVWQCQVNSGTGFVTVNWQN